MAEACWNCKKWVTQPEEASIPVVVKLGVTATMLFVSQCLLYPRHVCKRCRVSTILIGALGLATVAGLISYGLFVLISRR